MDKSIVTPFLTHGVDSAADANSGIV